MHETILYIIMGFVLVGFMIQAALWGIVAKSVFGRKENQDGGMIKNYIDGKVLERYYKINRVKD